MDLFLLKISLITLIGLMKFAFSTLLLRKCHPLLSKSLELLQYLHQLPTEYSQNLIIIVTVFILDVGALSFYTLSEVWSGVNWADLMAAQGAFGTDLYDRSTRTIVGTMLWTEYNGLVIKIGPKGALGSHEIRPIHSAPSLGQSIVQIGY